jgi:hypothetical protein
MSSPIETIEREIAQEARDDWIDDCAEDCGDAVVWLFCAFLCCGPCVADMFLAGRQNQKSTRRATRNIERESRAEERRARSNSAAAGDLIYSSMVYNDSGNKYEGTVNASNVPHGLVAEGYGGVFTYANGDRYEGDFHDGLMDGLGTLTYANGDVFKGSFKNGNMHGQGILSSVIEYEGALSGLWINGAGPSANCCLVFRDGSEYNGDMRGKLRHGTGVMKYKNGDRYDGEWRGDKRHGRGTMTFRRSGNTYDGDWKDDLKHGEGVFSFANGARYEGAFVDNLKHGKGRMTNPTGKCIEGTWVNDKRERAATEMNQRRNTFEMDNPMLKNSE